MPLPLHSTPPHTAQDLEMWTSALMSCPVPRESDDFLSALSTSTEVWHHSHSVPVLLCTEPR
jgi:hypothetical protein